MLNDKHLVEKAQEGCSESFTLLFQRHKILSRKVAYKVVKDFDLAEDIAQESFLKVYRSIKSFNNHSSFKSWLYRITLNTALNKLRKNKRPFKLHSSDLMYLSQSEQLLELVNLRTHLNFAIQTLPQKQQHVLKLSLEKGWSLKKISDHLDSSYETTKANYRQGLIKLKKIFFRKYQEIPYLLSD